MVVESVGVLDFRNLADVRGRARPGAQPALGAERRREDEPARGDLHRPRRPLVPDPRRPRDDRLRPVAGPESRSRSRPTATAPHASSARSSRAGGPPPPASTARPRGAEAAALRPAAGGLHARPPGAGQGPARGPARPPRRFCAALWPARAEARRRYSRALAQRNALLGRIRAGGLAAADASTPGTPELADGGVELIAIRAAASRAPRSVRRRPPRPSGSSGGRRFATARAARPRRRAELAAELAERRDADLARGYTGWGPHHDELAIERDGRSLRRYGSQGQQRTGPAGAAVRGARRCSTTAARRR